MSMECKNLHSEILIEATMSYDKIRSNVPALKRGHPLLSRVLHILHHLQGGATIELFGPALSTHLADIQYSTGFRGLRVRARSLGFRNYGL